MAKFELKILEKITIDEKLYKIKLERKGIEFKAGQFIAVVVGENIKRYYSIASSPKSDTLDLIVTTTPGGPGSIFFEKSQVGDSLSIIGPLGNFVFKSEKNAVFVCTGTGIAPLLAMIEEQIELGNQNNLTLVFGTRYQTSLIEHERLLELQNAHPNFKYHVAVSRPTQDWTGHKGRVTDFISTLEFDSTTDFYICGAKDMVLDVKKILLDKKVEETRIYHELY